MNKARKLIAAGVAIGMTALAHAQTAPDPVEVVEGAATASQAVWVAIAGLSATAFVFAMLISFARKGKK